MAIAMDTSVQSNFAFAPLKMTHDPDDDTFRVRANPFGTYHGRQYRMPTWGNGQGYEITLRTDLDRPSDRVFGVGAKPCHRDTQRSVCHVTRGDRSWPD